MTASPATWTLNSLVLPDPRTGLVNLRNESGEPVAASGAWTNLDTYELWLAYVNGVYGQVWTFAFSEDGLTLTIEANVAWADATPTVIKGQASA